MNNQISFQQLEHEESKAVVSFKNGTTFKISKLMDQLNNLFINLVLNTLSEKLKQADLGTPPAYAGNWNKAVEAEILEPRSGFWKKGKLRMRVILEFCPDEPEQIKIDNTQENSSSLDNIRQTLS
ncbi:MAG: KGK domain-containing protein [Waterburya sp.]